MQPSEAAAFVDGEHHISPSDAPLVLPSLEWLQVLQVH